MIKNILLPILLCTVTGTVFAETPNYVDQTQLVGVYFGLHLGYGAFANGSEINAITKEARDDGIDASDSGFVGNVEVGYNFNKYIAAQIDYLYLPRIHFSYDDSSSSIYNYMFAGELKAQYPLLHDKLIPFVTAGYGVVAFTTDDDNADTGSTWEPIAGAGLEYRVSKHVGVNGQYKVVMNVNNEFGTVNMGLFGVNFYF